jgi:hypothetical protein
MSTLQNTTQHPDRIKTRPRTGALALSMLIALGAAFLTALLILPTAHATTRPPTASSVTSAASGYFRDPATHKLEPAGLGDCLVNPSNQAVACYQAAQAPIATSAASGYFRDPATHKLEPAGLGDCLVNPSNQAVACYQAAQAPIATPAASGYFRDPATHKLEPAGLGDCLVNPSNPAAACYQPASGYFRDPAAHNAP